MRENKAQCRNEEKCYLTYGWDDAVCFSADFLIWLLMSQLSLEVTYSELHTGLPLHLKAL